MTAEQNVEALKRRLRLSRNANVRAVVNVLMSKVPAASPTHVELIRRVEKAQRKDTAVSLSELFNIFINAERNFGCCSRPASQALTKVNEAETTQINAAANEAEVRQPTRDTQLPTTYNRDAWSRKTTEQELRTRPWKAAPKYRGRERHVRRPAAERYFKESGHCSNCGVVHKGPCMYAFPRCKACFRIHDPKEDCPTRESN